MRLILAPLYRAMTALGRRSSANDESFVNDPRRARRLIARDVLILFVALAALNGPWSGTLATIATFVLAAVIGMTAWNGVRRAHAYRSGWLDGRQTMMRALDEAVRRGMTPSDWIAGEIARDFAVMGVEQPKHRLDESEGA